MLMEDLPITNARPGEPARALDRGDGMAVGCSGGPTPASPDDSRAWPLPNGQLRPTAGHATDAPERWAGPHAHLDVSLGEALGDTASRTERANESLGCLSGTSDAECLR